MAIARDLPIFGIIEAWAELHQTELKANWERLQEGRPPGKIEPLS